MEKLSLGYSCKDWKQTKKGAVSANVARLGYSCKDWKHLALDTVYSGLVGLGYSCKDWKLTGRRDDAERM